VLVVGVTNVGISSSSFALNVVSAPIAVNANSSNKLNEDGRTLVAEKTTMSKHKKKSKSVTVYLDGAPLCVPRRTDCHWGARGALGIARGTAVAHEGSPDKPLLFLNGHTFTNGERYVTVDGSALFKQRDEPDPADWWKN
jgi:hypothetical protein